MDCDLDSVEFSFVSEKGEGVYVAVTYVTIVGGENVMLAWPKRGDGKEMRGHTQNGMPRDRVSQSLLKSLVRESVT